MRTRTIATTLALVLLLAGCGGSDARAVGEPTAETATDTTSGCHDLGWDISPGAFSGGVELPAQLYGSYGPGQQQRWTPEDGPYDSQGGIDEILGAPNGVQMIRWGDGSSLDGRTTVECSTGWGCFDDREDYGWENGIIYDLVDGEDVVFPHIWKLSDDSTGTRQLEVWEVKLTPEDDAMAAIDDLRAYIEGESAAIDRDVFYISAPDMDGGIPTVSEQHFTCDGASS